MYNDYELVSLAQEKDEIATNILYDKYYYLIKKKARKIYNYLKKYGLEFDDVVQELVIGFENAINNFNQDNDASFFTFANICMDRNIISLATNCKRNKYRILNEALQIDIEENFSLLEVVGDNTTPESELFEKDSAYLLFSKIDNKLTFMESMIFELKINGYDYKEISNILDIDAKHVYNCISRIKAKIRKLCNI